MYEEEEDAPRNFAYSVSHLPGRFQTYATVHLGMAGRAAKIERDFERYFGHQLPASQAASAAHLQHGLPLPPSGIPNHASLSLQTRFDPRTQLEPGHVMSTPQPLPTTPLPPASFARAAAPGPLKIPDNASFMRMSSSPQTQASPFTPGIAMGLPYRPPSSHHAHSPRHVSSPTVSFGDHASPMSTSSHYASPGHYASPLHTPIHETSSMSAALQRSRSASYTDMASMAPPLQHRIPSFGPAQAAEPSSHSVARASALRHAELIAIRDHTSRLQHQQSLEARLRQFSEGSIYESKGLLAQSPVVGGPGVVTQPFLQQRRLSEQVLGYTDQLKTGRSRPSMFSPELPAHIQALVCGVNQEGLPRQPSSPNLATGLHKSPLSTIETDLDELLRPKAHTEPQTHTSTPADDRADAEPFLEKAGTAVSADPAARRTETTSTSDDPVAKTDDGEKSSSQALKHHDVEYQGPEEGNTDGNDFSHFLLEGGMDFSFPSDIVDNSMGAPDDPFFTGNQPFDISDAFDFNMDEFVDFPQSQPNDDDNKRSDDHT